MACKIADNSSTIQSVLWAFSSEIGAPGRLQPAISAPARPSSAAQPDQIEEVARANQTQLVSARQTGFEAGLQKGRDETGSEVQAASDRLAQTLGDLAVLKRRIRSEAESDVVQLSLAVARRILYRELSVDPESIQGIVHAALKKLQNRQITRIRTAPAALAAVQTALEKAGVQTMVSLSADPRMRLGELVFETSLGELDASVETQLQEIERGFSDRLGLP